MPKHFNPMHHRDDDERVDSGDEYEQHELHITEIREKSIFVQINEMSNQPMGRSLLHAASDDRIANYRGPLPIDMILTVKVWWLKRYGFIKDND